jgi:hypothetical protein
MTGSVSALVNPCHIWGANNHRVRTEWKWPIFGVHSIMMEKSAPPGERGGVARPPPFTISAITYEVVVYTRAERADKHPYFYSTHICPLSK